MKTFNQFVDKKTRKAKKHLKMIEQILSKQGLTIKNHLDEGEEPFLFVVSPVSKVSFQGIRIYQTGESIAYRIQKEEKTHPYGRAYRLDIQEMYDDLVSDDINEEQAAKEVMQAIVKELQQFFEKSYEAERELRTGDYDRDGDPLGRVMMRSTGTDYSNSVMGHNASRGRF
ncbi:MAG: hypothetical protein M0R80_08790 [Proteobacteria bacterium]|jgi:hypothetical protein|nr:hypothetical protein [Pseudomonadota bacterium]